MGRTLLVPILILFVFSKIVLNRNMLTSIKKLREFQSYRQFIGQTQYLVRLKIQNQD